MSTLKKITRVLKALADENRIRILYLLSERKDLCVCEIREVIGLSQPTISSHLKLLENNELVTFNKDGKWVNYSINPVLDKRISQMLNNVFSIIEFDEIVKKDRITVNKINRKNLCKS
ncbi:MAG: metalloregulator ArsR/SmtB family transcription factor [Actinobacteria bacterium]|nr:metalloregulator ArsR/SmtB family transcription factor [Actinomycetota bacterium]